MPNPPFARHDYLLVIKFCLPETLTNWFKYMNTRLGSCRLERKTVAFSCQRQLQQPDIQSALAHGNFCPWQLAYGRNLPRAVCSTPNFPTRSFSSHPSLWTDELHSTCRSMVLYASVINSPFSIEYYDSFNTFNLKQKLQQALKSWFCLEKGQKKNKFDKSMKQL